MSIHRLLVASDTHLAPGAPEADANWDAVVRFAEDWRPELVVHLGDLSRDGMNEPTQLAYASRRLAALPSPWVAIPGNHDVGDNAKGSPHTSDGSPADVNGERLDRWRGAIGRDWWSHPVGTWTLVGLNAQILDATQEEKEDEAAQWAWLSEELDALDDGPVVLLSHKPISAGDDELAVSGYRFVPPTARRRLAAMLHHRRVLLVLSGHVHQFRELALEGRRHVWAPTTWAVLPEESLTVGVKRCGCLLVELDDGGEGRVEFVQPPGLAQLTLGTDLPDPYLS